jgi:hypothetical protein
MERVQRILSHLANGDVHSAPAEPLSASECIGEMENRQVEDSKNAGSYQRVTLKIAFPDKSQADERYGGSGDMAILEGELLLPKTKSKTAFIFMHPYV